MTTTPNTVVSVLRSPEVANTLFYNYIKTKRKPGNDRTPTHVRADIVTLDVKLRNLYEELAKLEAHNSDDYVDTAMTNFGLAREEILTNKYIVDMFISGTSLYIQFKDIDCYIGEFNSTYDFGSYLVRFDLSTASLFVYSLKYFVVDRSAEERYRKNISAHIKKGEYPEYYYAIPHPHVREKSPCLGNLGGIIAPLLAKFQYGTIVELLTSYLQSCNMNDGWGIKGTAWPLLKGPGVQKWSKEVYPNLTEDRWKCYVSDTGDWKIEDKWTPNNHVVLEFDTEELLRCILNLPKDRRTLAETTEQKVIEVEPESEEEITESEAEITDGIADGPIVYYDDEGYLMQADYVTQAAKIPVATPPKRTAKPRVRKVNAV